MRTGVRLGIASVLLALTCISCGNGRSGSLSVQAPLPAADPQPAFKTHTENPMDWDRPVTNGMQVQSTEAAQSQLGFSLQEPRGLGNPRAIFVSQGPESERGYRAAGYVFDSAVYGRVVVSMKIDQVSRAARHSYYQSAVSANSSDEIVTIRGNVEALLFKSDSGGNCSLTWDMGGVEIWIGGPQLQNNDCLAIAEKL